MNNVPQKTLLEINRVEISYRDRPVILDMTIKVGKGEILGIVGESGSGKSTLAKAVIGLLGNEGKVASGEILYKGNNLLTMSPEALRKKRGPEIGMVFQNHASSLCPIRTIGDQFYESVREHRNRKRNEVEKLAKALFEKMNLKDGERILKSYPFELSGGMSQRVGIAMAMLLEPDLLLADEPTSALDVIVQVKVAKELQRLRDEKGTAIVMVTHNISLAAILADNIAVINKGRLMEYGAASTVIYDPQHAYTKELIQSVPRMGKG